MSNVDAITSFFNVSQMGIGMATPIVMVHTGSALSADDVLIFDVVKPTKTKLVAAFASVDMGTPVADALAVKNVAVDDVNSQVKLTIGTAIASGDKVSMLAFVSV